MGNFRLVLVADDSPMPEGVAQKGTGVRLVYFKRVGVILAGQAVMVAGAVYLDESRHDWIQGTCALSGLVLPFIAYIVAFYDNPKLAMRSPAMKTGLLTLLSIILTISGFCILMFAGMTSKGEL